MFQRFNNALYRSFSVAPQSSSGGGHPPADEHEQAIGRLRFRIAAALAVRHSLRFCFAWIMLWAVAAVALRIVWRLDVRWLLWGGAGLAPAILGAVVLAWRQAPSRMIVRALLDRHGCLGGLLMTAGDTDIGTWRAQMAAASPPRVHVQVRRPSALLTMAATFLAAAFLMPDAYLPAGPKTGLELSGEMRKLNDQIQLLRQEEILPPDKAEVLQRDLNQVRREAQGEDPAKTMEALDHLDQQFRQAAKEAAETALNQTEQAAQLEELAKALQQAQKGMDSQQFGEAMKELSRMANQAAAENAALSDSLTDALKEALPEGALSEEQLRQLCESLGKCKAGERTKIAKLIKAKLIDADQLAQCDEAGQIAPDALAEVLAQCKSGKDLADAMGACEGGSCPGRGGISRGRADAAMTWSEGAKEDGAKFKEKVLPPAAVAALKESRLTGVSLGNPTTDKPSGGSKGGALTGAGGGESRAQRILPEHEKAVQRYFQREKK